MAEIAQLSDSGQKVFDARYAQKDDEGCVVESFEQAVYRLAKAAALAELPENKTAWEEKFASFIGGLLFVPSTPIWANMGKTDRAWQPGACFVLAVEDSLESMYQTLKDTALVFKSGGGVGYNFSSIRPRGSIVSSTKGQASGVVELVRLYDASSGMVMQGGVRRGASMGILNVDHPEIIDFINSKRDGGITHFNLSVGITDAFMEALDKDQEWPLVFNGKVYQTVRAVDLWNLITESAHACGDPGIIFIDRLQRDNPVPSKMVNSTNPCGEQPLSPGESCLLGSINLAKMVKTEGESCSVDWELLRESVELGMRFLDNMIDVAEYPLDFIAEATRATRKVGLGYTGLHDLLIMMNLPYDSEEGRAFAGTVLRAVQESAHTYSGLMAEEKGCFPDWEQSVFHPGEPRRNAACITVAPTGSVTTIAGCEGYGIEPIFAVAYTKDTDVAGSFEVFSPLFVEFCNKYQVGSEVMSGVAQRGGCRGVDGVPEEIARIFKGAQEIRPEDHILMQAEVQRWVDNAVSKTCNLPNSAEIGDINTCYRTAYDLGLKGITVFRDGCKQGVITVGRKKGRFLASDELGRGEIMPRPDNAHGVTHRLDSGCGKIYLTVNYQPENGAIMETFITTGSDGGCLIYTEATSRLISLAIRGGIDVKEVIEQLQSTHACPSYQLARGRGKKLSPGKSCASAIARKLTEIKAELAVRCNGGHAPQGSEADVPDALSGICEMCGLKMDRAEGCWVCRNCGYSKC